jgi:hypothetical protein
MNDIEKISGNVFTDIEFANDQKMLECLNKLARDIQIVIRKANRDQRIGRTSVVFA